MDTAGVFIHAAQQAPNRACALRRRGGGARSASLFGRGGGRWVARPGILAQALDLSGVARNGSPESPRAVSPALAGLCSRRAGMVKYLFWKDRNPMFPKRCWTVPGPPYEHRQARAGEPCWLGRSLPFLPTQFRAHAVPRHSQLLLAVARNCILEWGGDPQNPPKIHWEVCGFGGFRRSFWSLGG
eukprot:gene11566-biopygen22898